MQCKTNKRWKSVASIDGAMTLIRANTADQVQGLSGFGTFTGEDPSSVVLTGRVLNQLGQPLANADVTFTLTSGAGRFAGPTTLKTGADGTASTTFERSTAPGTAEVSMTGPARNRTASFTIISKLGPPARITAVTPTSTTIDASGQADTLIQVQITDRAGNPIPYAQILAVDVDDTLIDVWAADGSAAVGKSNADGVFSIFASGVGVTANDYIDFIIAVPGGGTAAVRINCAIA
jgi:protocatechuate 3,4-dioxygenase beta subunit